MRSTKGDIEFSQNHDVLNIVSVEDDPSEFKQIKQGLTKYMSEQKRLFVLKNFADGNDLLKKYERNIDLILMDIELKNSNGMETAEKVRAIDKNVIIIFVTKMAQFAVSGYQVQALDFLVKPYTYANFALRIDRALRAIDEKRTSLVMKSKEGIQVVKIKDIMYIDVYGHSLGFHTIRGTLYIWGALSEYEAKLGPRGFLRCDNSALVNASHIKSIDGMKITLDDGQTLSISHPRKKAFMESLASWAGYFAK